MSTSKTLKKSIDLTPDQVKAVKKLISQPEWGVLTEVVEQLLAFKAYNLAAWVESDEWDVERQARDFRGGFHFWEELLAVIDAAINKKDEEEERVD